MQKKIAAYLIFICFALQFQTFSQKDRDAAVDSPTPKNEGIQWIKNLSRREVLKKAKKENKYIFVDCYATWCGPCKNMDKNVYPKKEVGEFFNKHFISVHLQMDKTKKDNEEVRNWYSAVTYFNKEFGITGYPTLLFFTPKGELVNRGIGFKSEKELIEEAKKTMHPGMTAPYKVYYRELAKYQQGAKDYTAMAGIADTAKQLYQDDIANAVAKEYRPYLQARKSEWYTPSNLSFMARFIKGSTDPFFEVFYTNGSIVDSILNQKGISQNIVDTIIQREEIEPVTKVDKSIFVSGGGVDKGEKNKIIEEEPDWKMLHLKIAAKYNEDFATRNILRSRVKWYRDKNQWDLCARYLTVLLEKYPIVHLDDENITFLNTICWNAVFMRSVSKKQIDASIQAMGSVIKKWNHVTHFIDTYANLLYKAGRTKEAIKFQKLALELGTKEGFAGGYQQTLERMTLGKPTWPHYIGGDSGPGADAGLFD